jgi:hypothetical protein
MPVAWIIIVNAMSDRPQVQFSMRPPVNPAAVRRKPDAKLPPLITG